MIWKAQYKDGTIISEYNLGKETNFLSIDKDQVDRFTIIESGNDAIVRFSADTGNFNFDNLDLRKLESLGDNAKLILEYDKDRQNFRMSEESLKQFDAMKLEEEAVFDKIEFDQLGNFYLNNELFYLSFEFEGKSFRLNSSSGMEKIVFKKQGYTEFKGRSDSIIPCRRNDDIEGYYIGYEKIHDFSNLQIFLSLVIHYNVIYKTVTMHCKISSNKMIEGKVVLHYQDKLHAILVTLIPHLPPTHIERGITRL